MRMQVIGNEPLLSTKGLMDYFETPPIIAGNLIAIGCASLLLLGLPCLTFNIANPSALIFALMWTGCTASPILLGIIIRSQYDAKPRPADEEYEAWVRSWQPSIQSYGMRKLGLEQNDIVGEILVVRGQIWPNDYEAAYYRSHGCPIQVKRGKDGHPHASINKFTVFYPTQHYIAIFNGDVNALSTLRFAGTRTYFYDDVVGVDAYSFGEQLGGFTYNNLQRFELRISSGQSIGSAVMRVTDDSVDQTVRSLRTLLRDKKYGIIGGGQGLAGS